MYILWQLQGHAYRNGRVGQQSSLPIYEDVEDGDDDFDLNNNQVSQKRRMAQQPITQDIVVQDVLKAMTLVEGAVQYLVLNSEGIPIKKSASISAQRALHLSFLLMDYWSTTKKVIQSDLKMSDNVVEKIRIRTSKQKQIIIIQSFNGEATLYMVQNCERKKEEVVEEKKEAPKE